MITPSRQSLSAGALARSLGFSIAVSILAACSVGPKYRPPVAPVQPFHNVPPAAEYEASPYAGFGDDVLKGFGSIVPADADVSTVAEAIVKVVDAPFGKRPFRVHIDPTQDGAEVVNGVLDRVRAEMLRRIGLSDVLKPYEVPTEAKSAA